MLIKPEASDEGFRRGGVHTTSVKSVCLLACAFNSQDKLFSILYQSVRGGVHTTSVKSVCLLACAFNSQDNKLFSILYQSVDGRIATTKLC